MTLTASTLKQEKRIILDFNPPIRKDFMKPTIWKATTNWKWIGEEWGLLFKLELRSGVIWNKIFKEHQ